MDKNKNLESKMQSMSHNHEDSLKASNGFKSVGNAMVGEDKRKTKGKK